MNKFSTHDALKQPRQLGIRLRLDATLPDLTDHDVRLLFQLVARHGVICIEDQPVSPRHLHEFTSRWGEVITLTPGLALANQEPGWPSVTRVGNIRASGEIIPSVRLAEYWHHDGDFWAPGQNHILNFLVSVQVPPVGGHTGFLDTRRAYVSLDDALKVELKAAYVWVRASEISDFRMASADELPPDVRHPVSLLHPITKEMALYLPDSSTGIQKGDGQPWGKTETLIELCRRKLGIYEHAWAEGDLLIIDNLQVMHRGIGGYGDHPRLLYRCQARIQNTQ